MEKNIDEQVIAFHNQGLSGAKIAKVLKISGSTASGIIKFGSKQAYNKHLKQLRNKKPVGHIRGSRSVIGEKELSLVHALMSSGLNPHKISIVIKLPYSTVRMLSKAKDVEEYHHLQRNRSYKYLRNIKGKGIEVKDAPKVGVAGTLRPVEDGIKVVLTADQWNTLVVKLNAMHYDIVAIKNKRGLMF